PFVPAAPDTRGTMEGGDVSAFATWVAGRAAVANRNGKSKPKPSNTAARTNAFRVRPFSRTGRCTTRPRSLYGPTRLLRASGGADPAPRRRPVRAPADQFPANETSATVRRPSEPGLLKPTTRHRTAISHSRGRRGSRTSMRTPPPRSAAGSESMALGWCAPSATSGADARVESRVSGPPEEGRGVVGRAPAAAGAGDDGLRRAASESAALRLRRGAETPFER